MTPKDSLRPPRSTRQPVRRSPRSRTRSCASILPLARSSRMQRADLSLITAAATSSSSTRPVRHRLLPLDPPGSADPVLRPLADTAATRFTKDQLIKDSESTFSTLSDAEHGAEGPSFPQPTARP